SGLPCSPAVRRGYLSLRAYGLAVPGSASAPAGRAGGFRAGNPPAWPARRGSCRRLAVLDLLDHLAAELAADQLHPGQVLPPGGGWASVIRPLLVGGGGGLRPWRHRAGASGAGLLAAGRRRAAGILHGAGGTAVVRRRPRPAGSAPRLGSGRRIRRWRAGGGRAGGP